MATITKLPSGKWKAIIRFAGCSRCKTFKLKTSARAWANQIERDEELAAASGLPGARILYRELAEQYLNDWTGKDISRTGRVGFWIESLGDKKLTQITEDMILTHLDIYAEGKCHKYAGVGPDFKTRMKDTGKPRSDASVNRMLACISATFVYALDKRKNHWKRKLVVKNPCEKIKALPEPKGIIRFLSDDERERLLAACANSTWDKLTLFVTLLMQTGMRLGEAQKSRWSDVDFKARTILLRDTKNGSDRLCPVPDAALAELSSHRQIGTGLIFGSEERIGRPFGFRPYWNRALKQAGIENLRVHDLRHDFCSQLALAGKSMKVIKELAGHRDITTTDRYVHLSRQHVAEEANDVMNKLFKKK